MTKIVVLHAVEIGEAQVLEAPFSMLEDYTRSWENWPEDLGIYDLEGGLWIWEGNVSESEEKWIGTWRRLNDAEWAKLRDQGCVL